MKTLIIAHCEQVRISVVDYFRLAHYWQYHRLLNVSSFREDIIHFEDEGKVPPYVRDYVMSRISEPHVLIG